MFSVHSPRPLRGCGGAGEGADSGRELRRESARRKRGEQERLDAEEADYRRSWEQGNELFYSRKYQEAAAHYTEALKKNPNEPAVLRNRAQCHIFLGALPEGPEDAEKCIELDPTYLMGYVCKAKVQALMQNYESAMATYIEGLKCDPNSTIVIDGFKRCMTCIEKSKDGDVGPEDLEDILRDWHSDIYLSNELKKYMEEVAVFKKEASDERLRRIESEQTARTSEANQVQRQKDAKEHLSKIQQELQQFKARQDEVANELQKANKHNEHAQNQLLESKKFHSEELQKANERYNQLQSKLDVLLKESETALKEVEKLRRRSTVMPCQFSLAELERATENFSTSMKFRECGVASVYRGVLWKMKVAIKVLRHDGQGRSQFEQEVAIHSRVRHPNLVILLGACKESSTLVYESLPNGSLEDFLSCEGKRQTLTWQIRIRIIAEICSALIFLHENKPDPIVHGDLQPANILLDANFVSKLSDFGISHLPIQSNSKSTKHPVDDTTYKDPECLATQKMTPHSDAYSFGMVVLRLLTGKPPVGIKKIVEDAMQQGDLNSIVDSSAGDWPVGHIQQLADLALICTEQSSRSRPVLSGQLWTAVENMRDGAMLSSPSSSSSVKDESIIPSHFTCAISHEIMKDPHFAEDGFTYEGDLIRKWLQNNNRSPMTNKPLQHRKVIPNNSLRSAIQEWLQQHSTLLQ
ncbi:U-box domain-containing protein 70-like [Aegilops tauschii subsp. strangulata]|uniref:RING-type E3 ubiquitin transferase n=7 Tax=Aegilops tauschii TaxID=37682 RepID=A0A453QTF8_AEGTS|nr:U-box domain-containing protein 70-like [Aegilops tauschii subsp. strangulata]